MDAVGYAHYSVGEVRLRIGDLDGAAAAFERAYELGHEAQPGLALLQLARGEVDEASRSVGRALAAAAGEPVDWPTEPPGRGCYQPRSTSRLAARDLETAGRAVDELESIAADYQRPLFEAGALTGRGELLLGEDRTIRGLTDPGSIVAALAADGPAVRERAGAPPLCRGDGCRRRPGDGSPGSEGGARRLRATGREARPGAG